MNVVPDKRNLGIVNAGLKSSVCLDQLNRAAKLSQTGESSNLNVL